MVFDTSSRLALSITGFKSVSGWSCRLIVVTAALIAGVFSSAMAEDTVHDLTLPGIHADINLAEYKGKLLYIDFWASWCAPCLKSFPWMNAMQQKYADQGLQIIAINMDKEKAASEKFIQKTTPVFLVGFDPEGLIAEQFNVIGMPNSFLFDGVGRLISSHVGFRQKDQQKYEAALVIELERLAGND